LDSEIAPVERRGDAVLAKEARRQRDVAFDVIEEARVDLRKNERDAEGIGFCWPATARAVVAQIGKRQMNAFSRLGPHGLIVAQDAIDRGHADARSTRNHHTCGRHCLLRCRAADFLRRILLFT